MNDFVTVDSTFNSIIKDNLQNGLILSILHYSFCVEFSIKTLNFYFSFILSMTCQMWFW